ncbi:hypothetical protein ABPG75_003988 [Micractinium tetrahymenae]
MANAVQKIVMELALLGFVSLLLTAFSKPLGRACSALNIPITDVCSALANGTRLEAAYGTIDPSLLGDLGKLGEMIDGWGEGERRRRLLGSTSAGLLGSGGSGGREAAAAGSTPVGAGCWPAVAAPRGTNPLQVLLSQDPNATTQRHLLPRISLFKCTGPFMPSSCPDGQVPLISENALHQMHIYLFLVAIFHVAVSVVQFLLGRLRLRLWRRWERHEKWAGPQAAPPPAVPLGRLHSVTRQNFLLMRAAWLAGQPAHPLDTAQHEGLPKEEEQQEGQAGKEERSKAGPQQQQQQQQPASGAAGPGAAGGAADAVHSGCRGRCSGAVSRQSQERQAAAQPDFVDHLMDCLEDDLPAFVGLSVEMGVVACVMLLLAKLTGWIGPLFLIVASVLLLGTNMTLVALLRHSCRGGQPHSSAGKPDKWWRNPHLLLAIPIRLILFLCSCVYSSVVLFTWQFGNHSCFFTSEGDVWGVGGLPGGRRLSGLLPCCCGSAW